jgi:hypothetical protein
MEHTFLISVKITIETDKDWQEAIAEWIQEAHYAFDDTDGIKVLKTSIEGAHV